MARSTIKYLKKLGHSNAQIAEIIRNDPRTVARALIEPTDKAPTSRERLSSVAVFQPQIEKWFDQSLQVKRMLELARQDPEHPSIWNPVWEKLAAEFGFHPEACAPASGNQKGAVENLVKYTENNFLTGRSFYDEADLDQQLGGWLHDVNYERKCQATEKFPATLLVEEQNHFGELPASASDYGMFDTLVVNSEATVTFQTNRYSVPSRLVGQPLTARIHLQRIKLYDGSDQIADHPRSFGRKQRIVEPEHFEAAFEIKPRGKTLVYRDWLVKLSPLVQSYIAEICHKQRSRMTSQIQQLYTLARQVGTAEFVAAVELAMEQGIYGSEYLTALTFKPTPVEAKTIPVYSGSGFPDTSPVEVEIVSSKSADEFGFWLSQLSVPAQAEIERNLEDYERWVANRSHLSVTEEGTSSTLTEVVAVAEGGR